jgi:ATP-dependent Clp protease ATP-binding subunit ClpB
MDEMEKAHADVWSVLLQVLDDGRLTDGQGRTVDFKNTVVIMTSNATDIKKTFRPEFLNRIDEIVEFAPLTQNQLGTIVNIQLGRFTKLLAERGLTLALTDRAIAKVAEAGYDPDYGARPLKRALQRLVIDPLASALLEGKFHPGDHLTADVASDGSVAFVTSAEKAA